MLCFGLFSPFSSLQPKTSKYEFTGTEDLIYRKKFKILGITFLYDIYVQKEQLPYKTFLKIEQVLKFTVNEKFRSSHQKCSMKKSVFRNFTKSTGKHLCQNLFFNKVVGLRPATLLKKRLWHKCFPMNFAKFLRTPSYRTPLGDYFRKFVLSMEI